MHSAADSTAPDLKKKKKLKLFVETHLEFKIDGTISPIKQLHRQRFYKIHPCMGAHGPFSLTLLKGSFSIFLLV